MYFYIFDPRGDRETKYFERMQGRFLNLLAENRIEGEDFRVTAIRTIDLLMEQAAGTEAHTVVVVGSDGSLNRAVNAILQKRLEDRITLGYVPLDPDSDLGRILGMSQDVEQCAKTLAARLTLDMDLGSVGEHYFLSRVDLGDNLFTRMEPGFWGLRAARQIARLSPFQVEVDIEGHYRATSEILGMQIINSRSNAGCRLKLGNPTDGLLDVLLLGALSSAQIFRHRRALASGCLDNVPGATVMHAKRVEIIGPKKLPLSISGQMLTKAPATVTAADRKIKMIVGKDRQF